MTAPRFDNSYARLPERFFAEVRPEPAPRPALLAYNEALARTLGADAWDAAVFAGTELPEGTHPIALAYAGHQFGHFVPTLGDGRAVLLGEVLGTDGQRYDIQLKGSGQTPFSRRGDGKAALGPVLREYIVAEAMAALGVPTTRALAAVTTGAPVQRQQMEQGAVLTRVARAHIRVGSFQYFAARGDLEGVRLLADHTIERLYPEIEAGNYLELLRAVVTRQAGLIAQWMGIGFIHGVMNTDNMSIAGETIDYGPCAFMDRFDPATVYSSIDAQGRYAYQNQPGIAQWNLAQFATCLVPVMGEGDAALAQAQAIIDDFPALYQAEWLRVFGAKIGLATPEERDIALIEELLDAMHHAKLDFTNTFRNPGATEPALADWQKSWRSRLAEAGDSDTEALIARCNPAYIPRNHRVEAALAAAAEGDLAPFEKLMRILSKPYDAQPEHAEFQAPPRPDEEVVATFCGT